MTKYGRRRSEAIAEVVRSSPLTDRRLAEAFGLSERQIRRIRAPVRRAERQRKLERAVALAQSRVAAGYHTRESE